MDILLLCFYVPLREADPSFRGDLLAVCVCLIVCDLETLRMRQPRQELDFCDTEEKTEGNEWVIWKCCWECLSDVTIEVILVSNA